MKVYSIWNPLRIFYYIFKIFGQASFTIDGKIENGKIRVTVFDGIGGTVRLLIGCWLVHWNIFNDFSFNITNSFIIDLTNYLVTVFLMMNALSSSISNNLRRNQIWSIFNQLHDFDKQVTT